MAAMPYPCYEAGAAVWLTSVIAPAQYSLKESIISVIGGVLFLHAIQFLYSSEYILHHLMSRRPMSMMLQSSISADEEARWEPQSAAIHCRFSSQSSVVVLPYFVMNQSVKCSLAALN